ncbi:MAG: hypothetical protein JWO38_6602 [Gemmataceae bacterium]|nr:hypothetical protein [Gemmataceae bacterium]
MNVLVVDIGGSHVKMLASGHTESRQFDSGKDLTPRAMVDRVREMTADWRYDVVSLGYPGKVGPNGPEEEPGNLAHGWVGFDFGKAFGKPVRVVNDAAMQAIGGYTGGRMLFLGLGTGLGSALVAERVVVPLELGNLPYKTGELLSDRLGKRGLEKYGKAEWVRMVGEVTGVLRVAMMADYVVLGGGNAAEVDPLPEGVRRGGNADAFTGGFRLWEDDVEPHDRPPSTAWRVVP